MAANMGKEDVICLAAIHATPHALDSHGTSGAGILTAAKASVDFGVALANELESRGVLQTNDARLKAETVKMLDAMIAQARERQAQQSHSDKASALADLQAQPDPLEDAANDMVMKHEAGEETPGFEGADTEPPQPPSAYDHEQQPMKVSYASLSTAESQPLNEEQLAGFEPAPEKGAFLTTV